jgi:glycogen debranching enzyme
VKTTRLLLTTERDLFVGFSPANSPHLTPAWELDTAMIELSGKLASLGLPTKLESQGDLDRIGEAVQKVIEDLKLWQFYVLNVEAEKKAVGSATAKEWKGEDVSGKSDGELVEIVKRTNVLTGYRSYGGRFITKADPAVAAGFVKAARPNADASETWGKIADILNVDLYAEANDDAKAAKANIIDRLKYTRLDAHGPRLGEISASSPLIENYFTHVPESSKTSKFPKEALSLANNGWIWAADPLSNFAEYPGKAYVRREVIAWGDCVKLRYGKSKEDNPWLWDHITSYCQLLAELFDGFRLDNCHSTPLAVGVHMIDAARAVNPNLYVMAELFTGSQEMDLKFVSQIGINSLVREAYNGGSPKDFSGL